MCSTMHKEGGIKSWSYERFHAASYVQNQGQRIHLGFSNDIKVELANCEYLGMLVRNQCAS